MEGRDQACCHASGRRWRRRGWTGHHGRRERPPRSGERFRPRPDRGNVRRLGRRAEDPRGAPPPPDGSHESGLPDPSRPGEPEPARPDARRPGPQRAAGRGCPWNGGRQEARFQGGRGIPRRAPQPGRSLRPASQDRAVRMRRGSGPPRCASPQRRGSGPPPCASPQRRGSGPPRPRRNSCRRPWRRRCGSIPGRPTRYLCAPSRVWRTFAPSAERSGTGGRPPPRPNRGTGSCTNGRAG